MATQPSIKVEIQSPYRGGTRVWSNRFYLDGPDWASQTQFDTLSNLLVTDWKTIISTRSTIISTIGYNAGSDVPVFSHSYSTAGTYPATPNPFAPLENCGLMRFSTAARTSKNHPIYLFKYVHDTQTDGTTSPDLLRVGLKSSMAGPAAALITGYNDGTQVRKLTGPRGAHATGSLIETYLHHRDFPS